MSYELIRSKKTIIGSKLKERSEPVRQLLQNFDVEEDIIDFIEKCLVYDIECRITPHDAVFHQWFYVQSQQQNQLQPDPQPEEPKLQKAHTLPEVQLQQNWLLLVVNFFEQIRQIQHLPIKNGKNLNLKYDSED